MPDRSRADAPPTAPPTAPPPSAPIRTPWRALEPPPRPPVTSDLPPPRPPAVPARPGVLRVSLWAWHAGLVAGVLAVVAAGLDRDRLRAALTESARDQDPGATDALLRDSVQVTVVSLAVAGALLLVATLWGLALVRRRRPAARWVLLVTGVLTVVAVDVGQGLVSGAGSQPARIGFLVQGGLVLLAVATLLAPPSGRWIRGEAATG